MEGIVKFFNVEKGFGFIKSNEDDKEYFVHISGLEGCDKLNDEDKVTFEIGEGKRGPMAVSVKLVTEE